MSQTRKWATTIAVILIFVVAGWLAFSGATDFRSQQDQLVAPVASQ